MMEDRAPEPLPPPLPKEDPEALVLRGRPRPVVRFRRGLIIGVTASVAAGVIAVTWLALEPVHLRSGAPADEQGEPARKPPLDALANAPSTYGEVPKLGPPLPGDLGRPILDRQRSLAAAPAPSPMPGTEPDAARAAVEAERQRVRSAREAAFGSPVLFQLGARTGSSEAREGGGTAGPSAAQSVAGEMAPSAASPAGSGIPASQQRKIDFARSSGGTVNAHVLEAAPSPWTLSAGTIIPASLITGLDSDLPGTVFAQVTENVFDSATGRTLLIPQGARLVGAYDSVVAYGQKRALLVWQRIIFPDGSSIQLDNTPATDAAGYAGVPDKVDFHTWRLLKGIGLSTLLGVGTQLGLGGQGDLVTAIREATQQNASRAADQITLHNLDVQPTIRVRPGFKLLAVIHKDLVLRPWRVLTHG